MRETKYIYKYYRDGVREVPVLKETPQLYHIPRNSVYNYSSRVRKVDVYHSVLEALEEEQKKLKNEFDYRAGKLQETSSALKDVELQIKELKA